ncbi:MAG: hypothetical protein KDB00_23605 [Planctomycetales bacterium]|nr:hypothetical protein [Planctomycetales bacterium]
MLWIRPLLLTLQLMGLSVLVAATIGIPLAFLISLVSRRSITGNGILRYCVFSMVACLATPMILHAAAWEATAGKFGWLTFSQTAARTYTGFAGQYGGLVACVWIHGLYGAAMVALATWFGTTRVAPDVIDQSRFDGGPIWSWWMIRLPIAAPWVSTGLLATAILAATEMTVVDLYGVRTLADEFYLFHAAEPSITSIMMVLVLPCVLAIALITMLFFSRHRRFDVRLIDTGELRGPDSAITTTTGKAAHRCAGVCAVLIATLMFAFPLAGLVMKTGQQVTVSTERDAGATIVWSAKHAFEMLASAPAEFSREYLWTAALAGLTSLICLPLGWVTASLTRLRPSAARWIDIGSLVIFLIPGPIVGLVTIHLFTLPVPGFHELYHDSLVPTVFALMVRALPVSYWIIRAGYSGLDSAILDLSKMDLSWWRRMWLVDRALLVRPLMIAGFCSAVMASGDVPATLPVLPPEVVTVGTRLFALLHSGARNQEASLAFWYVGSIVIVAVAISYRWKLADR